MTDRENHTTSNGVKLTIADQNPDQVCVMMYDHRAGPSSHIGMILPTSRLLAMIDTIAPDAMRAYLRETVEPAPSMTVTIADLVDRAVRGFDGPVTDPRLPEHIAAGIAEELLTMPDDAWLASTEPTTTEHLKPLLEHFGIKTLDVPEADSPEDIDEPAVIELSDDIDTRLHVIERLAKILRAGTDAVEVCTLADWVIDR